MDGAYRTVCVWAETVAGDRLRARRLRDGTSGKTLTLSWSTLPRRLGKRRMKTKARPFLAHRAEEDEREMQTWEGKADINEQACWRGWSRRNVRRWVRKKWFERECSSRRSVSGFAELAHSLRNSTRPPIPCGYCANNGEKPQRPNDVRGTLKNLRRPKLNKSRPWKRLVARGFCFRVKWPTFCLKGHCSVVLGLCQDGEL